MLTREQSERIKPRLLAIQIVSLGILMGAILFAGVVATIIDWNDLNRNVKLMSLIGAATGCSMYGLAFIALKIFSSSSTQSLAFELKKSNQELDEEQAIDGCLNQLLTNKIIFSAIVEGAIFLNLMTFMLEQSVVALTVAGAGILLLVISFPFKSRLIGQLTNQLRGVKEDFQLIR